MSTVVWIAWALSVAGCEDPGARQQAAASLTSTQVAGQNSTRALVPPSATPAPEPAVVPPQTSPATLEAANGSANGSLGLDEIQKVIRAHNLQVQGCYQRELANAPRLAGYLTVRFTISATGGVTASEVVQSHGPNAGLEQCVAAQLRTWAFPKPNGGVVRASYRFVFRQAEPLPSQPLTHRDPIQL